MVLTGKCFVKSCKNALRCAEKDGEKRDKKVTYHRFPKNKQKRQQWAKALHVNEDQVTDEHRVCSNHFFEKDIDNSLCRVRLREGAVPFTFREIASESNDNAIVIKTEANPSSVEIPNECSEKVIPDESNANTAKKSSPSNLNESMTKRLKTETGTEELLGCNGENKCDSKKKLMFVVQMSVSPDSGFKKRTFKDRATSVSPERIFHCPTITRIRENYKMQLRKEKQERYRISSKLRRAELKVASMKKVMDKLRENKFLPQRRLRKLEKCKNPTETC